jgi:PAS domain S-box-containing protein
MKSNFVIVRLGIAFGCLMLILAGITWLGIHRTSQMTAEINEIAHRRWEKAQWCREALRCSSANMRITMELFLTPSSNQSNTLRDEQLENSARISEMLGNISARVETGEEKALVQTVWAYRERYVYGYRNALGILLEQGRETEAREMMVNNVLGFLVAYHNSWEDFARFQGGQIHLAANAAEARIQSTRKQVLGLFMTGIILCGVISVFTTRGLIREIAIRQHATSLEQVRAELELRVSERTEELSMTNVKLQAAAEKLTAAHEELQQSEQKFRTLSESAPIGIFLTDAAGSMVYCNPRCKEYSPGYNNANWLEHVHASDRPALVATLDACREKGGDFMAEFRLAIDNERVRWVHTHSTPLKSESGETVGHIGTIQDITERKESEDELERVHRELIRASREAGIAEVATGVLHNVKNVITSINISASVIADRLRNSRSENLAKVAQIMKDHSADLGAFLTQDPRGKLVPVYLEQLASELSSERNSLLGELKQFDENLQHVKSIVVMQQTYAKMGGMTERIRPVDLMEDALRINISALTRHGVQVVRTYEANLPEISIEKHKALQILVNFIRNGKHACQTSPVGERKLVLRATNGGAFVHLSIIDNGIGIAPEHRGRIFERGFTTKKEGHGFGLHSGMMAARDMGAEIQCQSEGLGKGAAFTLKLPLSSPLSKANDSVQA